MNALAVSMMPAQLLLVAGNVEGLERRNLRRRQVGRVRSHILLGFSFQSPPICGVICVLSMTTCGPTESAALSSIMRHAPFNADCESAISSGTPMPKIEVSPFSKFQTE
jgi:hypothetical protein